MEAVKAFNNELSSVYEVKPPISKAKMAAITKAAMKSIKFYKHVVQSVEKFVNKCRPEYKVPGLYVMDSIIRQSRHQFGTDKDVFAPRFTKNIVQTLQCLLKCPEEQRPKIVRVLNLWQKNDLFPISVIQPLLDIASEPNNGAVIQKATNAINEVVASQEGLSKPLPVAKQRTPSKQRFKEDTAESEIQAMQSDVIQAVTALLQQSQDDATVDGDDLAAQQQQLQQLQILQQQLVQHSQMLNQSGGQIIDSGLLAQIQTLTNQLLAKTTEEPADESAQSEQKFDKELLNFDYESEEEDKPVEPQNSSMSSSMQNILSDPNIMHHIQEMSQTIQNTEKIKQDIEDRTGYDVMQNRPLQVQEDGFGKFGPPILNTPSSADRGMPHDFNKSHAHGNRDASPPSGGRRRSRSRDRHGNRIRSRSRDRHRRHHRDEGDRDRERGDRRHDDRERERRRMGLPSLKPNHAAICTTTLWIGHLNKATSRSEIEKEILGYGEFESIVHIQPRGCAYVTMTERSNASRALNRLRGARLGGSNIKINWAQGKGVKDSQFKDGWDLDFGVTWIPWENLPSNMDKLLDGGFLDPESLPPHMRTEPNDSEPARPPPDAPPLFPDHLTLEDTSAAPGLVSLPAAFQSPMQRMLQPQAAAALPGLAAIPRANLQALPLGMRPQGLPAVSQGPLAVDLASMMPSMVPAAMRAPGPGFVPNMTPPPGGQSVTDILNQLKEESGKVDVPSSISGPPMFMAGPRPGMVMQARPGMLPPQMRPGAPMNQSGQLPGHMPAGPGALRPNGNMQPPGGPMGQQQQPPRGQPFPGHVGIMMRPMGGMIRMGGAQAGGGPMFMMRPQGAQGLLPPGAMAAQGPDMRMPGAPPGGMPGAPPGGMLRPRGPIDGGPPGPPPAIPPQHMMDNNDQQRGGDMMGDRHHRDDRHRGDRYGNDRGGGGWEDRRRDDHRDMRGGRDRDFRGRYDRGGRGGGRDFRRGGGRDNRRDDGRRRSRSRDRDRGHQPGGGRDWRGRDRGDLGGRERGRDRGDRRSRWSERENEEPEKLTDWKTKPNSENLGFNFEAFNSGELTSVGDEFELKPPSAQSGVAPLEAKESEQAPPAKRSKTEGENECAENALHLQSEEAQGEHQSHMVRNEVTSGNVVPSSRDTEQSNDALEDAQVTASSEPSNPLFHDAEDEATTLLQGSEDKSDFFGAIREDTNASSSAYEPQFEHQPGDNPGQFQADLVEEVGQEDPQAAADNAHNSEEVLPAAASWVDSPNAPSMEMGSPMTPPQQAESPVAPQYVFDDLEDAVIADSPAVEQSQAIDEALADNHE